MEDNPKDAKALLEALRQGKREAIQLMYDDFFPGVLSFVRKNQGNDEDAKDLFQECLFYLYRYLENSGGEGIENLSAYFRGMYRNRWFHHLNRKVKQTELLRNYENPVSEEDHNYYIYLLAFEKLGEDCKEVLTYYVEGKSTQELADLLNTSIDYAKRKKYLCKESLKKIASQLLNRFE